jgi:hypothetical protein
MPSVNDSPDEETVLAELELTRTVTVQLAVVGSLGFLVAAGLLSALYGTVTGGPASFSFRLVEAEWWNGALDLLVLAVLATAIVVPHEWLHGLAMRRYGGEPRYGVGVAHFILPYAYATTDHRFTRNEFLVVLLAPLVGLTLVGVPLMLVFEWSWLVVPLAANAGGAVGDVWMALVALGYPSHVQFEDHADGIRILGRPADRAGSLTVGGLVWDTLVGGAVAMIGTLLVFGFFGPFVLSALGVTSLTIGTPGSITFLFEYLNTPDEFSYSVGTGWLFVGGLLGLVYGLARTRRRRRLEPETTS